MWDPAFLYICSFSADYSEMSYGKWTNYPHDCSLYRHAGRKIQTHNNQNDFPIVTEISSQESEEDDKGNLSCLAMGDVPCFSAGLEALVWGC